MFTEDEEYYSLQETLEAPRRSERLAHAKVSDKPQMVPKTVRKNDSFRDKSTTRKKRSKKSEKADKLPKKTKPPESWAASCLTQEELNMLYLKYKKDGHFHCVDSSPPVVISRVENGKVVTTKIEISKYNPEFIRDLATSFTVRKTERPLSEDTHIPNWYKNLLSTNRANVETFVTPGMERSQRHETRDSVPSLNSTVFPNSFGTSGTNGGHSNVSFGSNGSNFNSPQFSSAGVNAPQQNGIQMPSFVDTTRPSLFDSRCQPSQSSLETVYEDESFEGYPSKFNATDNSFPLYDTTSSVPEPLDSKLWLDANDQTSSNARGINTSTIRDQPQPNGGYSIYDNNGRLLGSRQKNWKDYQRQQNSYDTHETLNWPCYNSYDASVDVKPVLLNGSNTNSCSQDDRFYNSFETVENGANMSQSPNMMNNFLSDAAPLSSVTTPRTISDPGVSLFRNAGQSSQQHGLPSTISSACSRFDNTRYQRYIGGGNYTCDKENIEPTSSNLYSKVPNAMSIKQDLSSSYINNFRQNSGNSIFNSDGELYDPDCCIIGAP